MKPSQNPLSAPEAKALRRDTAPAMPSSSGAQYPKTGYIHSDFRLFYLRETAERDFVYHYHDFHKLLLFFGGNVGYAVEGRTYDLNPHDIVLVRAGQIHRPVIRDALPYERLILYLSPDFLTPQRQEGCDLNRLFEPESRAASNLLQISQGCLPLLDFYSRQLKDSLCPDSCAAPLFQRATVLSFLAWLMRMQKDGGLRYQEASVSNPMILQIIDHINKNLTSALTIDGLAAQYHVSRSWLMHLFKAETGYSIRSYLAEKRLFLARRCIQNGMPVTQACFSCGFTNYTSFYKAFRSRFGFPPKDAGRDH